MSLFGASSEKKNNRFFLPVGYLLLAHGIISYANSQCVSLEKSKIRFLNPKITFCISLLPLRSWCIKGTEESLPRDDSSVPSIHHDLSVSKLQLLCPVKKCKIHFKSLRIILSVFQ